MANSESNTASQNEIVLGENEMVCSLTNKVVKATDKEMTLQSMIAMMTEEYGFAPEDMERDFKVKYEDANEDKSKTQKVDLAIFNAGHAHDADELIRFIIVAKDAKVKQMTRKLALKQQPKAYFVLPIVILLAGQMVKISSMFIHTRMTLAK